MYKAVAAIIFVAFSVPAWAQMTPEGLWRNIDDKTGEAKAEIRIRDIGGGVLNGALEKRLSQDAKPDEVGSNRRAHHACAEHGDFFHLESGHGLNRFNQSVRAELVAAVARAFHPGPSTSLGRSGL